MTDNATAGAMPVVPDATSGQTASTEPAAATPATGATDTLGDAGKRALDAERAAAKAASKRADDAEKALEALKLAGASDTEKAIAAARKEGADEVTERFHAQVRRSEVKAALASAGMSAEWIDLAVRSDEFSSLPVNDDGEVEGLDKAVAAFKAGHPTSFAAKRPAGSADAGSATSAGAPQTSFTREQLRDPAFYKANKDAILAAAQGGRIRG